MSQASLLTDAGRTAIRLERELPDTPEVVWQAVTQREQLRAWFPCDVIVEGGAWVRGAVLTFLFPPEVIDMTLEGEVLEVDEPRRLVFTWGLETLRFELSPHRGGTLLVLIDELPDRHAARNAAGWDACLDRLAGLDDEADAWPVRFRAYSEAFAPLVGAQEGPPDGYKGSEVQ